MILESYGWETSVKGLGFGFLYFGSYQRPDNREGSIG